MPNAQTLAFPPDFIWGAAAAAHQVEGANWASDCWALEYARPSFFAEPSADACDHLHRYTDDIALLAGLGLRCWRFSIEWARIEPEEGAFSQAALDHYARIIDVCWAHGVQPMATFHHFTNPRWVARDGGWADDRIVDRFARYCEHTADALGAGLAYACTINEINIPDSIAAQMHRVRDKYPEQAEAAHKAIGAPITAFFLFAGGDGYASRAIAAHTKARDAIKAAAPHVPVGMTMSIQECEAEDEAATQALAGYKEAAYGAYYRAAALDDFLGVQTYTRSIIGTDGRPHRRPPEGARVTQMGYEYRPQALAAACRDAWVATKRPIFVTENGIAASDDAERAAFIREALANLHALTIEGVDLRGYLYWSLLDNFEWLYGYRMQFGLIGVDRTTQARAIKPSAIMLGQIARANAL